MEISGKGAGLERGVDLTALEIEEGDEILTRDIDRGLLPVRQHHQTVTRPLAEPRDRLGDGHLLWIDRDGLQLVIGEIVGPDPCAVPIRLFR